MRLGRALPRAFFARPCLEVARDLVGAYLVRNLSDGTRLAGRLVEVEAYLGTGRDPASHAYRRLTPRNRVMFGPPGRLYVYRSYGIHACVNVVCEEDGRAAAVLLRAIEPIAGLERMRANRGLDRDAPLRAVASGPGRLARALAITLADYGTSALRGPICFRRAPADAPAPAVVATPRIGIREGRELLYRFVLAGSPFASRARASAVERR
ncbi:MAG: DNA-3-methyladenine glycosylase [Deltaproteobacteria bacterium]|nr:MAG: DNA-3-methyladenine glycosylase [Deltaproteobacteria bacterium]